MATVNNRIDPDKSQEELLREFWLERKDPIEEVISYTFHKSHFFQHSLYVNANLFFHSLRRDGWVTVPKINMGCLGLAATLGMNVVCSFLRPGDAQLLV